jgi:hypothetical protein
MFKLSGVAVLTAGLAGVGLFYAVWNWDTTVLHTPSTRPASPEALAGLGSLIASQSGAWRSLSAADEPRPAAPEPPAAQAAPQPLGLAVTAHGTAMPAAAVMGSGPVAIMRPLPGTTVSAAGRPEPPATAEPAPPVPPAALSAAPGERMSLAGPKEPIPRAPARAQSPPPALPLPADTEAPLAPPPKFGPEIFTRADNFGGY